MRNIGQHILANFNKTSQALHVRAKPFARKPFARKPPCISRISGFACLRENRSRENRLAYIAYLVLHCRTKPFARKLARKRSHATVRAKTVRIFGFALSAYSRAPCDTPRNNVLHFNRSRETVRAKPFARNLSHARAFYIWLGHSHFIWNSLL